MIPITQTPKHVLQQYKLTPASINKKAALLGCTINHLYYSPDNSDRPFYRKIDGDMVPVDMNM